MRTPGGEGPRRGWLAPGPVVLIGGYPPARGIGGGIILRRLLTGLERQLVVICSTAAYDAVVAASDDELLDCEHRTYRPWSAPRPVRRAVRLLNFLRTPVMAVRLVKEARGRTMLLVPWSGNLGAELFLAGWLAAVLAGSRLVVYELDDWDASLDSHQAQLARVLGHLAHGRILRHASTVLAISPPLADRLGARYGVEVEVMASAIEAVPPPAPAPVGPRPSIVFIGAIYGAQADAVARLVRGLDGLADPPELVLHTSSSPAELAQHSIHGPNVRLEAPVANEEVIERLRRASALFLPASFKPEQRHTVTTSLPTKTAEYLWSGVPVLVHGPPDSVVARLARDEGWGVVVDVEDEQALAAAVTRILRDDELRTTITTRARETAATRHDLARARRRIRTVLGVEGGGMAAAPAERRWGGVHAVRSKATTAGRLAQIRLEGRVPKLSPARRDLAEREATPYASHLPILLGLQRARPLRSVLELGAGDFSTGTFLDRACFPDLVRLTSVEVNPEWRAKVESSFGADPRLDLLGAGSSTTREAISAVDLEAYDLVFIDDSDRATERAASIAAVVAATPRHPFLVIHDFEVPEYRRATAALDHVFLFSCFNPMTGVGWNGDGLRAQELEALARRIVGHRRELAVDDPQGWVAALQHGV